LRFFFCGFEEQELGVDNDGDDDDEKEEELN
jgi:hypothetical protein